VSGTGPELRRKLVWLTLFRLAIVTVLLGGTAAVMGPLGLGAAASTRPLYVVIVATYAASLLFAALLRAGRGLRALAYAQIVLDTAIAAAVIAGTGLSESVFVFMFSLGIVNGSILVYRRGAVVAAALAIGVYLAVCWLLAPRGPLPVVRLFAHAMAFVATALLASYLAEMLRTTHERLEARESQIEAITALHEAIVQSLTSGLLTLDPAGRITFMNRAGEEMTGLGLDGVLGQPAARWFAEYEATPRGEIEWANRRGERLRVGYSVFPLHAPAGAPIGSAMIFQDLTQLRAMEEAMQRGERLADLGRVSAALAHELRNPLASMTGSIELLRERSGLGEEDRRLMEIVLREASRLEQLVSEFLAFARPAPLRRARVDLAAVVEDTLSVFVHDPAAASLVVSRSTAPAPLECDPDQIRQVLWNLLSNAAQAAAGEERDGGPATVRVACGPDAAGGAWMEVADDGPGIPHADQARIFLPFFTTKRDGTGLGLATVHRIVDAHGGTVTLDSGPSRGARFRVSLPARGADAALPRRDVG
jgi:two-component system sensor histidine kinase PilS (NtrC family)